MCASGSTLTQVAPPPRGSSGGLAAQTSAVAARLAEWAQRNGQLLQALRFRAMRLTAEVGPHLAPPPPLPPVMPAAQPQQPSPAPSPGRLCMSDELQWSSQALREVHALEQAAADAGAAAVADPNPPVGWVGRHQGSPGEATLGTGDTLPVPTEFV